MRRRRGSVSLLGAALLVPSSAAALLLPPSAAILLAPLSAAAQVGLGFRGGTLGFGGEVAVDLTERLATRGGVGLLTLQTNTSFDDVPVVLDFPDLWFDVGVDYYLNEEFRVGGGVVIQRGDPRLRGDLTGTVDIGGETLTPEEVGDLAGTIHMDDVAAFALIGFGRHTNAGWGLFVDAGAAFYRSPSVTLSASGGTLPPEELAPLLEAEARDFEDDMKTYFRIWPILSIGLRVGLGGGA